MHLKLLPHSPTMKPSLICLSLGVMLLLGFGAHRCHSQSLEGIPLGKIAFLKDDGVWLANVNGFHQTRITPPTVKVDDFLFSRGGKYLAVSEVVGSTDEDGIFDSADARPQRAVTRIVVLDMNTGAVRRTTDSGFVDIDGWFSGDKLLYNMGGSFDVGQFYLYDAQSDSTSMLRGDPERLLTSDVNDGAGVEVYIGESGRDLHLHNQRTAADTVLFPHGGNICDPRIAHDGKKIAFVEFNDLQKPWIDVVWLYQFDSSCWTSIYRCPAQNKVFGVRGVEWSLDDRYLGMFYEPTGVVFDVQTGSVLANITGTDFSWIAKDKLVLNRGNDSYVFDAATNFTSLFMLGVHKVVLVK